MQPEYWDIKAELSFAKKSFKKLSYYCFIFFIISLCLAINGTSEKNLVINEILFNPAHKDAGNEWVELYNPTNDTKNVNGWTISNKTGAAIVALPNWNISRNGYLVVHFGNGTNIYNFTDGTGTYFTNNSDEVFNNTNDDCALFSKIPSNSTIVDFVSWSSEGIKSNDTTYNYAVKAAIWHAGDYLNINWTNNAVLDGESIGRNKNSTDTNTAKDWSSHGGIDAYSPTPGSQNKGPFFSPENSIILVQAEANFILNHYGFNVTNSSHKIVQKSEYDDRVIVNASHYFVTTRGNDTILFTGFGTFQWYKTNHNTSLTDMKLNLSSNYGELVSLNYSSEESRLENHSSHINIAVSGDYLSMGINNNYQEKDYIDEIWSNANIFQINKNQKIKDNLLNRDSKSNEKYIIHSDLHKEVWTNSSDIQNRVNGTLFSMHGNIFFSPNNPKNYEFIIDKCKINDSRGLNLTINKEGYFNENMITNNLYKSYWNLPLKDNKSQYINLSGQSYHEKMLSGLEQVFRGNVTYEIEGMPLETKLYYVDGDWIDWDDVLDTGLTLGLGGLGLFVAVTSAPAVITCAGVAATLGTYESAVGVGMWAYGALSPAYLKKQVKLSKNWRDKVKPIINIGDFSYEDGRTCYTITAAAYKVGIGLVEMPLESDCVENDKCTDIEVRKAYTAVDALGNSNTAYAKVKVMGKSCEDNNPLTTDSCSPDGECKHECDVVTYKQDPETGACCTTTPAYENGNCQEGNRECGQPCQSDDPCVTAACNKGFCDYTTDQGCKKDEEIKANSCDMTISPPSFPNGDDDYAQDYDEYLFAQEWCKSVPCDQCQQYIIWD